MMQVTAGDRVRTGNIQLGRLMLYQLSYARLFENALYRSAALVRKGPVSAIVTAGEPTA